MGRSVRHLRHAHKSPLGDDVRGGPVRMLVPQKEFWKSAGLPAWFG